MGDGSPIKIIKLTIKTKTCTDIEIVGVTQVIVAFVAETTNATNITRLVITATMGNSKSTDDIVMSKEVYYSKLKEHEDLKMSLKKQESIVAKLQHANNNQKLENLEKIKEVISLKSKLAQYESLPQLSQMLNISNQIANLQQDITNSLNTRETNNEEIHKEIAQLKANVNKACCGLPSGISNYLPDFNVDRLRQLENELEEEIIANAYSKQSILMNTLTKLQNLPAPIAKTLSEIEEQIESSRATVNMQNLNLNPKYELVKGILVQQENELLKMKLKRTTDLNLKPGKPTLMFYNVTEETVDHRSDYEKVKDILTLFHGVSGYHIKVYRVGVAKYDKPRGLKVIFPSMDPVTTILREKYKLKNSCYSNVRIYPERNMNNN